MDRQDAENGTTEHLRRDIAIATSVTIFSTILIASFISGELAVFTAGILGATSLSAFLPGTLSRHSAPSTPAQKQQKTAIRPGSPVMAKPPSFPLSANITAGVAANDPAPRFFDNIKDREIKQKLRAAIRENNITLYAQPIVDLPNRRVRCHELYSRIPYKGDITLPAARYMAMARKQKMVEDIDSMTIVDALKIARQAVKSGRYELFFINITSSTLKRARVLRQILKIISAHKAMAPFIVFEVQQRDFDRLDEQACRIFEGLSALGCRMSVDNIHTLKPNYERMRDLNVRFMKLDVKKVMKMAATDKGATELQLLKRKLARNDVKIIVDKVETEHQLREIMDFDFAYAQGYLFSRPKPYAASEEKAA